jgi:hypothetical protein
VHPAAEVEASLVPVVPNLPRRNPEELGEVGLTLVQLALKRKNRNPEQVTKMPPSPAPVLWNNRRKSPVRVAEAEVNNSAGCTNIKCQQLPFMAENVWVCSSTQRFSLITVSDCV